jgi:trigger factor
LKKWIYLSNKNQFTKEQIEKDFDQYENEMKWQVIRNHIIREHDIKVSEDEIMQYARSVAMAQFQQYGMANVPDEHLDQFAQSILEKPEEKRRLYDRKFDDNVLQFIKNTITITEKEISKDKFKKMIEKK